MPVERLNHTVSLQFWQRQQEVGKCQSRPPVVRAAAGLQNTKTLSVREQLSGRLFLADSGVDVSVFPATESDKLASEGLCSLRAANGTGIMMYGTSTRHLDFPGVGLTHKFVLAEVTRPLLGADFFDAHGLCVDFEGRRILRLVNNRVVYAIPATLTALDSSSKSSKPRGNTKTCWRSSRKSSSLGVAHAVPTRGPPVFPKARRL